jgi:WD40 repeat protein
MAFTQHQAPITHLELTENLNYLVSASHDRSVRVWNMDDASLVRVIFFPEVITTFKLTMNGDILICGGEEGTIFVWNLVKPIKIHSFPFTSTLSNQPAPSSGISLKSPIISLRISIDERFVLVTSKGRVAYFLTSKLKEEKSKSAFEGLYGKAEHPPWEDMALNVIDLQQPNERLMLGAVGSRNMVTLFCTENC